MPKFQNNTENMAEFFAPSWSGVFHIQPGVTIDVREVDAATFRAKFPGFPETPDAPAPGAAPDESPAMPVEVYAAEVKYPDNTPGWHPVLDSLESDSTGHDPSVSGPLSNAETLG
jgi:hypothetical protein